MKAQRGLIATFCKVVQEYDLKGVSAHQYFNLEPCSCVFPHWAFPCSPMLHSHPGEEMYLVGIISPTPWKVILRFLFIMFISSPWHLHSTLYKVGMVNIRL